MCRFLLAVVFTFSGFVKAVDPMGSFYKLQDYLAAFGLSSWFPPVLVMLGGIALAAAEFCTGVYLFFGIRRKISTTLALLLMTVMTPLTLYLAIADPVSDCGCFGDALVLTNWQTFGKNVVLLVASVSVFRWWRHIYRFLTLKIEWMVSLYTLLFVVVLSFYCLYTLPILDFRPYKIGADIKKGMEVPPGAKPSVFETRFVLEKDGERREFGLADYPDSTWTFVEARTELKEKGYEPPIHDFSLTLPEMGDVTDLVLENPGYTFLLISTKLEDCDTGHLDEINSIHSFARDNGIAFYGMTASTDDVIETFKAEHDLEFPIATSDETMLKTVIRSNPGLVLLKNATVTGKWHYNDLPSPKEIESIIKQ